jgi:hypothetical protein
MDDNPFVSMVSMIRDDNKSLIPVSYRLGTVTSVSPCIVDVAGTSQDGSSLLKNDMFTSFDVGDQVLMIPIEDEQRYIILCRAVSV